MSSKKRIAAVAITIAALTAGSAGIASAHDGAGKGGVKSAENKAAHDAQHLAKEALVASTLGIDAATIKSRLVAGETLGAIAGDKKAALITALVAFETKEIDARVTAGTMTVAQATVKKANLTDRVTQKVDSVKGAKGMGPKDGKGPKGAKGHKDGMGKGKGPRH